MYIPYPLIRNLSQEQLERWQRFYTVSPSGFDRKTEEGLWRRTQEMRTQTQSGWRCEHDARRRMIHYKHHFDLVQNSEGGTDLAMTGTYLWMHLCFPHDEIDEYYSDMQKGLALAGWHKEDNVSSKETYHKNGLVLTISFLTERAEDKKQGRIFPDTYRMMEVTVTSEGYVADPELVQHPWYVLDSGLRTKDTRGVAEIVTDETLDSIIDLFPTQVELGCGSSIEAGIPPLGFLHEVYFVSNRTTHQFILGNQDDRLLYELITDTQNTFERFTRMFRSCFLAESTTFYDVLKVLFDKGYVVGDVITNNFDGLPTRLGMTEVNVRRYDEVHIIPHIDFDPRAKSLLVIGNHADRRKVEAAARKQGLKVVYIDPEGFFTDTGFQSYPLESPQAGDLLYNETASVAFAKIAQRLKDRGLL